MYIFSIYIVLCGIVWYSMVLCGIVWYDMVLLCMCSGILVPGGFGQRGTEGKILAINYARQRKIPFLGEGKGGEGSGGK